MKKLKSKPSVFLGGLLVGGIIMANTPMWPLLFLAGVVYIIFNMF